MIEGGPKVKSMSGLIYTNIIIEHAQTKVWKNNAIYSVNFDSGLQIIFIIPSAGTWYLNLII